MGKNSFVMYKDWKSAFNKMSDEQAGKMIKAVFQYQSGDTDISFDDPSLPFFFEIIKDKFEENNLKYKETCERNKENGSQGGRPPKTEKTQNNPVGFSKPNITEPNPKNPDNDSDSDNDIDNDLKEKEKRKRTTFTPPTLEEVTAYCKERNNGIDPESFVDFYTAKGWKIGKESMKDWKASVRTWEKRKQGNGDNRASFATNKKIHNFQEREMDDEYFRKLEKICVRN